MIRLECGIYVFEVYMFIYGLARVTTFIASVFLFSYPDPPLCIYCKYVFILVPRPSSLEEGLGTRMKTYLQ